MSLREHWRVIMLLVLLLASSVALFAPGATPRSTAEGPTNLQYGLELSGGTRIRAPLVGVTAEGVDVTVDNQDELESTLADQLDGVSESGVRARIRSGTIEVYADIEPERLASALDSAGVSYESVRMGVTGPTRDTAVEVLTKKIDESGLQGGTVQQVTTSTGEHFIVIEIPNRNRSQVEQLVASRGVVEVVAHFPTQEGGNEYRNVTVLTQEDISQVGTASGPSGNLNQPFVPVVLTDQAAREFAASMREFGFTGPGVRACPPEAPEDPTGYCLYTVLDDDVVYAASMSPGLAQEIEQGNFVKEKRFVMTTTNMSEARALQVNLRAGSLPAPLDIEGRGTSYFLAPTLAEEFKLFSLVTGLIAVLAVAAAVFVRYGDPLVAIPMVVTALSEVLILLGFAAAVSLALDLSHIAGLIAVIGTGVDDLIIIADEVISEGRVSGGRVFQTRFRRAFWVIGAAAITTVIAMSPLAILSLGDLRGFAIVTIVGVLIGVFITRPAYGDILRLLMADR